MQRAARAEKQPTEVGYTHVSYTFHVGSEHGRRLQKTPTPSNRTKEASKTRAGPEPAEPAADCGRVLDKPVSDGCVGSIPPQHSIINSGRSAALLRHQQRRWQPPNSKHELMSESSVRWHNRKSCNHLAVRFVASHTSENGPVSTGITRQSSLRLRASIVTLSVCRRSCMLTSLLPISTALHRTVQPSSALTEDTASFDAARTTAVARKSVRGVGALPYGMNV